MKRAVPGSLACWHSIQCCNVCGEEQFDHAVDRAVDGAHLVRCRGCGLVFLNPRPSPEEIAAWYQEGYFTATEPRSLGDRYLANGEAGIRHGTEHFFQLAKRQRLRGRRVLEVGAGGGAFIVQCRNAGARVTGLEVSEFAAQRLRLAYSLDIRVGTIETAGLAPASFEIVAFTDVLEHVTNPTSFMLGIREVLAPGGVVYGVVPNYDSTAHYGMTWAGLRKHAEHLYYFGRSCLEQLLFKTGLRPTEVWTYGEPSEPEGPACFRTRAVKPSPWKEVLRPLPGLIPAVRTARRWARLLSAAERSRQARYREGLGHDLYFTAVRESQEEATALRGGGPKAVRRAGTPRE